MDVVGLGLLTLAVIVLLGGLAWRQQALFEAERPSDGPAPMVCQASSMSNVLQLFAPFLVAPGLAVFTLAMPGYPMLLSWGGFLIVVVFSVIRFWRSRRRLELQGPAAGRGRSGSAGAGPRHRPYIEHFWIEDGSFPRLPSA